jgi:hypothetical protein
MTWTTEKPTVPGWYWWKPKQYYPVIVEIYRLEVRGKHYLMIGNCNEHHEGDLEYAEGEWAGPIPPPEEAQP